MKIITLTKQNHYEVIMQTVEALREGKVVVVPTDTVYGLAANAADDAVVNHLFDMKGRQEGLPMPVFVDTIERAKRMAFIEEKNLEEALNRYWPGALTAILYAREIVSPLVRGRGGLTVGARIPDHYFSRDLIRAFGAPITGTSANRSGRKPAATAQEVFAAFDGMLCAPDIIIDGGVCDGALSTVVDFTVVPPKVVREGAIPVTHLF